MCDCDGLPNNGCEAELSVDEDHCGSCNHGCLGGACAEAECQPLEIHSGDINVPGLSGHLAVDETHVFFVDPEVGNGNVVRIAHDGSNVVTLATNQTLVHALALDGAHVYWATWNGGVLRRTSKTGGAVDSLVSNEVRVAAMAVDVANIYWVTQPLTPTGAAKRAPKTGGAAVPLASGQDVPNDLSLDGSFLYWAVYGGQQIVRVNVTVQSPPLEVLYATPGAAVSVKASAQDLFWTEELPDAVLSGPSSGAPEPSPISQARSGTPLEIDADATCVYWVNDAGQLRRWARSGASAPEVLMQSSGKLHAIALSSEAIFYSDDGAIMKLAK
jgi:hypothetical protein